MRLACPLPGWAGWQSSGSLGSPALVNGTSGAGAAREDQPMAWRIGVDAGGTFTDVCLFDDSTGRVELWKVASTPDDPARGIAQGIEAAIRRTGLADDAAAARLPVRSAVSDPVAGLLAAQEMARLAGFDGLISFDMGGTRTAVALLRAGEVPGDGIRLVDAGGDSIACLDPKGRLTVGPGNSGPGPTVTDANLVLQTLSPDRLPGGRAALARAAVGALAGTMGTDLLSAAQGILSAVTATLAQAIRAVAPPRGSTLVAFGGAGPLHAARLARELDIARILVPRHAGTLGALGLLLADLRADFSTNLPMDLSADALPAIAEAAGLLRHRAAMWFAGQKIPAQARCISRSLELRYAGRADELPVPLPDGPVTVAMLAAAAKVFAAAHRLIHGDTAEGATVQLVTVRVAAAGLLARPGFAPRPDAGPDATAARTGSRAVWLPEAGGWAACPVYDRDRLDAGNRIAGPAIVEQMDGTTVILPGMTAQVDPTLNLVLRDGG